MDPQKRRDPESAPHRFRAQNKNSAPIVSPIDTVLGLLDRIKQTGPDTWIASCPTSAHKHGDRSRGLSFRVTEDGRVLIHCNGGCHVTDVVGSMGLRLADLFPQRQIDYPHHAPHKGIIGRGRIKRIPWPDLFEGIERDLTVCSLAFSDLAKGKTFSQSDAITIARLADHLANEISEVRHV